jgi:hypothetical protein
MPVLPLFAAVDVCGAAFVAGIVIMFLFWVLRIFSKAQEDSSPPSVRPRRAERDRQRDEIEEFTRQQTARRRGREEDILEVIEEARPPRRQGQTRPKPSGQRLPQQQRPGQPAPAASAQRSRPGETLSNRHANQSESLGSGVRSHLAEYMEDRIDQSVQQHLVGGVGQSVQQHLGAVARMGEARTGEHPIVRLLRDPNGVRTALILNEVLTRPRRTERKS